MRSSLGRTDLWLKKRVKANPLTASLTSTFPRLLSLMLLPSRFSWVPLRRLVGHFLLDVCRYFRFWNSSFSISCLKRMPSELGIWECFMSPYFFDSFSQMGSGSMTSLQSSVFFQSYYHLAYSSSLLISCLDYCSNLLSGFLDSSLAEINPSQLAGALPMPSP